MDDAVVEQGRRSYWAENKRMNNPYEFGTPEFNDFERGWVQACKRDSSLNSQGIAYTRMQSEPGFYDESAEKMKRDAQAYAKATGG